MIRTPAPATLSGGAGRGRAQEPLRVHGHCGPDAVESTGMEDRERTPGTLCPEGGVCAVDRSPVLIGTASAQAVSNATADAEGRWTGRGAPAMIGKVPTAGGRRHVQRTMDSTHRRNVHSPESSACPLRHVSRYWLWFTAFVGLNLFQSALTRWCLMEQILEKLGVPPCTEEGTPATSGDKTG